MMCIDRSARSSQHYVQLCLLAISFMSIAVLSATRPVRAESTQQSFATATPTPTSTIPVVTTTATATATPIASQRQLPTATPTPFCRGMELPTLPTVSTTTPRGDEQKSVTEISQAHTQRQKRELQRAAEACLRATAANQPSDTEGTESQAEVASLQDFSTPIRVSSENADDIPYRDVVQVIVEVDKDKGEVYQCTGFLLRPKLVGTAAHCVFRFGDDGKRQRVKSILVAIPGKTVFAEKWHTWQGWAHYHDYNWDFALLELSDKIVDESYLSLPLIDYSSDLLQPYPFETAGYPCVEPSSECSALYHAKGGLDNTSSNFLFTKGIAFPGQSGSGLFRCSAAYAVLSGKCCNDEKLVFVRFHQAMYDLIGKLLRTHQPRIQLAAKRLNNTSSVIFVPINQTPLISPFCPL